MLVDYLDYYQEHIMSRMFNPPHPGAVVQEYLPEGVSITEAAQKLGVSRQAKRNPPKGVQKLAA